MKKLICVLCILSSMNAFAYSEGKVITKMSAEGKVSEASIRTAANAILLAATTNSPIFGLWIYLVVTHDGPGLNADLDFLTYDQRYGLLANLMKSYEFTSDKGAISLEATTASKDVTSNTIQASAKKILGESDAFIADGKVSPEKTPELYRNAEALSEMNGMHINEAALSIIAAIEKVEE